MTEVTHINGSWEGDLVYAIACQGDRFVKIGKATTRTLAKRLGAMQVGNPYPLVITGTIPCKDGEATERRIHAQLDQLGLRVRGEWFLATAAARRVLDSHGFIYTAPEPKPQLRQWKPDVPLLPIKGATFDEPEAA